MDHLDHGIGTGGFGSREADGHSCAAKIKGRGRHVAGGLAFPGTVSEESLAIGTHEDLFLAVEAETGAFDPDLIQIFFAGGTTGEFVQRGFFNADVFNLVHSGSGCDRVLNFLKASASGNLSVHPGGIKKPRKRAK